MTVSIKPTYLPKERVPDTPGIKEPVPPFTELSITPPTIIDYFCALLYGRKRKVSRNCEIGFLPALNSERGFFA